MSSVIEGKPNGAGPTRILVVIVNFRTPKLTIESVASLAKDAARVPGVRAVVVENDSEDDSAERIRAAIAENGWDFVDLVVSDHNRGFAGGNNLGIAHGEPAEFVLLLNSDTIMHEGCLERCLTVMEEHPEAGAMSCRVLNADGSIQNVTRRFPTPVLSTVAALGLPWKLPSLFSWADAEDWDWDRTTTARDVDWLGGAFLFVRSSAFGGQVRLDEDFFFYGEDVAFSHVLKQRGFTRRYDPVASIVHLGGASSDPSRMPTGKRAAQRVKARYMVQAKCYGPAAARWLRGVDVVTTSARLLVALARGRSGTTKVTDLREQLRAIAEARKDAPA
jgi:N-acetylglucosaminyl-diphospho-decaprenol L-rhamnosyltransferase